MDGGRTAKLGVVGLPHVVANSLSPHMMRAAFDAAGISATYDALPVEQRDIAEFLRSLPERGFFGINVTMPYKRIAAEIADTRSAIVEDAGVANTLVVRNGTIHADATDGRGMINAISRRDVQLAGAHIVLLGAGGVATEAAVEFARAGVERIDIWNRTRSSAEQLAERLRNVASTLVLQVHEELPIRVPAHVLVGAVPADAIDPQVLDGFHTGSLLVDFAYRRDGQPTPMMALAARRAEQSVDGRELLVRQGAHSFRLWFEVEPPTEVMIRATRERTPSGA